MRTTTFRAIGTDVVVAVLRPDDAPLADRLARRTLRHVDETCSRFRPDSDLSRVNRTPGTWVDVDPLLVAAVEAAVEAARRTDGLVHPLLGRDLVTVGYDRDLAELHEVPGGPAAQLWPERPATLLDAWREIEVRGDALRIPDATALDLGSIGKAWAADLIAAAYREELSDAAAVSVGGDVALSADDPAWPVDVVEGPDHHSRRVHLTGGGLATSSTLLRRWRQGGVARHHLLDPRTGLPVPEVWTTATATGPSCVAANTASTAAIVLGAGAPAWLEQHQVTARLVASTGEVVTTGGWPLQDRRSA